MLDRIHRPRPRGGASSAPRARPWLLLAALPLGALLPTGCDSRDAIPDYDFDSGPNVGGKCSGKSDGTECGSNQICLNETCKIASCGDGVQTGDEECDDGNAVDDDGCNIECISSVCGNGYIDPYETCDDFNTRDGDGCASDCRGAVCGDREIQEPEVCDGPQVGVLGVSESYSCKADCSAKTAYACESCQQAKCISYTGRTGTTVNAVEGCLQGTTSGGDAAFLAQCAALVNCALKNRCGFDGSYASVGCFCGTTNGEDCTASGPAEEGPCHAEFVAAARTDEGAKIYAGMSDFTLPVAWASALLDCYRDKCADTCTPY